MVGCTLGILVSINIEGVETYKVYSMLVIHKINYMGLSSVNKTSQTY